MSETRYVSINPATGEEFDRFAEASDADIERALAAAAAAQRELREIGLEGRAALLRRVAEIYRERAQELGELVVREMGKPVGEAAWEADHCGDIYGYYAEHGPAHLADEEMADPYGGGVGVIRSEALGPLLGIMPWNFPYYQVARFAGPNLLVGNPILLKHAPICGSSAAAMEEIFREAGFPEGAYRNLYASHGQIARIIADPRVHGVSLTGSERAGAEIAAQAGRAMKKVVLELGGSDAFVVLDDADVDAAAAAAVRGRFGNAGQACTSSKRLIAVDAVYHRFVAELERLVSGIAIGNPMDPGTDMGPLSSAAARDEVAAQVADAVAHGATVRVGGAAPARPGFYYEPTLLTDVTPEARIFREEVFGPVAVVYRVADEAAAVAHANDADFGLGGTVFSGDPKRAWRVAGQLETGMVWINSEPQSAIDGPFGGVKRSGTGRELGRFGLEEFSARKMIRRLAET
ncbi:MULTISPECIES: aldehyde dehydrogenase family protein [unclassified Pseudarthrobacter]|uniref:aldehyde dehydrogenase family protein n=1 Tax=unclassified Pseudarthrobacter TaxID=2647000 RepID=UPI0030773A53